MIDTLTTPFLIDFMLPATGWSVVYGDPHSVSQAVSRIVAAVATGSSLGGCQARCGRVLFITGLGEPKQFSVSGRLQSSLGKLPDRLRIRNRSDKFCFLQADTFQIRNPNGRSSIADDIAASEADLVVVDNAAAFVAPNSADAHTAKNPDRFLENIIEHVRDLTGAHVLSVGDRDTIYRRIADVAFRVDSDCIHCERSAGEFEGQISALTTIGGAS